MLLNYHTSKCTVWKNKLNTNFRKSARRWPYRPKDLIHFWQIHNFCERLICDWSFLSYFYKWNVVYSAVENSELPHLQKTQTQTHIRRSQTSWPVWVQACHNLKILGNTVRNLPYYQSKQQWSGVMALQQMKRPDTKTVDEHYREGTPTHTEVFKLPHLILIIR